MAVRLSDAQAFNRFPHGWVVGGGEVGESDTSECFLIELCIALILLAVQKLLLGLGMLI